MAGVVSRRHKCVGQCTIANRTNGASSPDGRRRWLTVGVRNLALAVLVAGCAGPDPEPGAVRLAALTAGAAADVLSDLAAVDDPDAAGVRDAFHAANVTALDNARLAHDSAPRATRAAYALSLEAAETAGYFAEVLGAAIEARDDLTAQAEASRTATEAAALIAEIIRRRADGPRLEADAKRLGDETRRLWSAYRKWSDDTLPAASSASRSSEEWESYTAESARRRQPANDADDAFEAALAAFSANGEAQFLAEMRFLGLTLDDVLVPGQSDLLELAGEDFELNADEAAQAEAEAETLAQAHAVALANTREKVRVAEDWHARAIGSYRAAATAWRGLIAPGLR